MKQAFTINTFIKNDSLNNKELKSFRRSMFTLLIFSALLIATCRKEALENSPQNEDISTVLLNKNMLKETVPADINTILSETNKESTGRFTNATGSFIIKSNGNIIFRKTGTHIETISN